MKLPTLSLRTFPILLLLVATTSCSPRKMLGETSQALMNTPSISEVTEPSRLPTKAAPATALPLATITATEPSIPQRNPTVTITPVRVTPTLTSDEKVDQLSTLMQLETECRLPCWWSIAPGLSKADEVKMALESYGFLWGDDDTARLRAGSIILALQFEFEKDVVQAIHVRSEDMSAFSSDSQPRFPKFWQPYGPAPVVNHYGRPSRVFVYHPFQFDAGGGPTVHLVLDYKEQGITIEYLGSAEYLGDNRYRTCATIETVGSIGLHLRQSGTANDVIEQLIPPDSVSHIAEPEMVYDRISWQSATGTDLGTFYDLLQESGESPCFEFSSN